jgi:hypothetical protein
MIAYARMMFFVALLATSASSQSSPRDETREQRRCGGVSKSELDAAYAAALARVKAGGFNEQRFRQMIRKCPKQDLKYFKDVARL